MKFGTSEGLELDGIDLQILQTLQQDCKIPLARIGDLVGLSAPSVIERIKKLEQSGVIRGYHAALDSRRLGLDVTAFIGVVIDHPASIEQFEDQVSSLEGVLECHHVTGQHTLLLKAKTQNTSTLEKLISRVRTIPGVARTETMVVLSTHSERVQIPLGTQIAARAAAEAEERERKEVPRRKNLRGPKLVAVQPSGSSAPARHPSERQ
ncbi:MAG TPA: Lrp/AsnC family transcriptional regulator [Candidatus Binatia bacterium]|nr:Lrp/AsnC family transcriptional regulator [Candidatus Binatia bacterium]